MTMRVIQEDCFEKLKKKYGKEFNQRTRALKTDPSLKASDIAREFGISKMTPKISKEDLETLRQSKYRRKMLEKILNTDKEAPFVKVKKKLIKKLLSMGMEVIPFRRNLFIVNGWFVDIRIATKIKPPMAGRTKSYYSFGNLHPSSKLDFFVFVCGPGELCYILPAKCLTDRKAFYVPVGENNRYSLFKEKWEWLSEK